MTDHYYTNDPHAKSEETTWTFPLRGKELQFTSDAGVFSKNTVDYGSRLLVETFTLPAVAGDLLDMGCGYGPIGLALAAAFPERIVDMVDVNERALHLARKNAKANRITNVNIYTSSIYAAVDPSKHYAAIVTNPPIRAGKQVVHEILAGAYERLAKGGTLTAVIQKKQGAPSAEKKMQEVFGNVTQVTRDKGYWILVSEKEEE